MSSEGDKTTTEKEGESSGLSSAAMEELESQLVAKILAKLPPGASGLGCADVRTLGYTGGW
jgi:hypothetical protein